MDPEYIEQLKAAVNKLLSNRNVQVTDFAAQFADGVLFEILFRQLFGANFQLQLVTSTFQLDRKNNWKAIDAAICVRYFNKKFYLLEQTIVKLALGQQEESILKVLKAMVDQYQERTGQVIIVKLPTQTQSITQVKESTKTSTFQQAASSLEQKTENTLKKKDVSTVNRSPTKVKQNYISIRNRPQTATLAKAKVEEEAKTDSVKKIAKITDSPVKSKNDSAPSPVKSSLKKESNREGSGNRVRISDSMIKDQNTRNGLSKMPDANSMKPSTVVDKQEGIKVTIPMSGSLQQVEKDAQKQIAQQYFQPNTDKAITVDVQLVAEPKKRNLAGTITAVKSSAPLKKKVTVISNSGLQHIEFKEQPAPQYVKPTSETVRQQLAQMKNLTELLTTSQKTIDQQNEEQQKIFNQIGTLYELLTKQQKEKNEIKKIPAEMQKQIKYLLDIFEKSKQELGEEKGKSQKMQEQVDYLSSMLKKSEDDLENAKTQITLQADKLIAAALREDTEEEEVDDEQDFRVDNNRQTQQVVNRSSIKIKNSDAIIGGNDDQFGIDGDQQKSPDYRKSNLTLQSKNSLRGSIAYSNIVNQQSSGYVPRYNVNFKDTPLIKSEEVKNKNINPNIKAEVVKSKARVNPNTIEAKSQNIGYPFFQDTIDVKTDSATQNLQKGLGYRQGSQVGSIVGNRNSIVRKQKKDDEITELRQELHEAQNALDRATQEQQTSISKQDVAIFKSMKRPSQQAVLVAELILKVFGIDPYFDKLTRTYDYWTPALKLISSKTFLVDVQNFDVSELSIQLVIDIEEITNSDEFNLNKFQNASGVVYNFARWVLAVIIAFRSLQVIAEFEQAIEDANRRN